jgi:hypothetical protein
MGKMRLWKFNDSTIYSIAAGLGFFAVMSTGYLSIDAAVDDAYIVYRYVDRFLALQGLTYNNGEHVEGFTSLLWTLLLAAGSLISGGQSAQCIHLDELRFYSVHCALHDLVAANLKSEQTTEGDFSVFVCRFHFIFQSRFFRSGIRVICPASCYIFLLLFTQLGLPGLS